MRVLARAFPNLLLSLLEFPPANEIWVRVLDVVAGVFANAPMALRRETRA